MTFGALALPGGGLTMASIAVLPVLIGLAVDYAIQFQARFDEARARGRRRARGGRARRGGRRRAHDRHRRAWPRPSGFLVLLLSPVPMVRGFGALVVVGIVLGPGVRPHRRLRRAGALRRATRAAVGRAPVFPRVRARARGAGERIAGLATAAGGRTRRWREIRMPRRRARGAGLAYAVSRPRRVLAVGLAVAIVGWAVDTQSVVVSDVRELVPRDLQALKDVNTLQEETGVSGEIDVTVRADDITRPR